MSRPAALATPTRKSFAMDDILDAAPPVDVSNDTLNSINSNTNPVLCDAVGRDFRVGVRFKMLTTPRD
jgi:hypothetical protein